MTDKLKILSLISTIVMSFSLEMETLLFGMRDSSSKLVKIQSRKLSRDVIRRLEVKTGRLSILVIAAATLFLTFSADMKHLPCHL